MSRLLDWIADLFHPRAPVIPLFDDISHVRVLTPAEVVELELAKQRHPAGQALR